MRISCLTYEWKAFNNRLVEVTVCPSITLHHYYALFRVVLYYPYDVACSYIVR